MRLNTPIDAARAIERHVVKLNDLAGMLADAGYDDLADVIYNSADGLAEVAADIRSALR